MKNTLKKSAAIALALAMLFTMAFSVNAADFKSTKTSAFITKLAETKAVTVNMEDYSMPLIGTTAVTAKNIVATVALNGEDDVDINAGASVSLASLNVNAYYDGSDIYGYFFICKVNVSKVISSLNSDLASSLSISADMKKEIAKAFSTVLDLSDGPVFDALVIDSQTADKEVFSISPVALIASVANADEATVNAALTKAGLDTASKTDKEIKDAIVEMNNRKALAPVLNALNISVTQEELDEYLEYIYDTFEFDFNGSDLKNVAAYDENGETVFNLADSIPFEIASVKAEKTAISAPAFGIDVTSLASFILKLIAG